MQETNAGNCSEVAVSFIDEPEQVCYTFGKKEKRNRVLARSLGVVIAAAVVCWIGFSGYSYYQEKKPMTKTELSTAALSDYLSGLTTTDSASE